MIQINLLPGAQKRKKGGALSGLPIKLPEKMPDLDRMMAFIVVAWILGPLIGLWLFLGVRGDMAEVETQLQQAVADSVRYASVIETQTRLRARQDTIAEKLQMIQEIDAGRYIWPHIMDEVSRALPPFTWVLTIDQTSGGTAPRFQLQGRSGSYPALTRFMDALEASPFLRNIQLISSEQAQAGSGAGAVSNFVLNGSYEIPSLDVIETVPLFETTDADSVVDGEEADNGTGTT